MFAATVEKLDEVFVSVKDLPKMRAFYGNVLGFEEEFHHGDWGVGLRTGGSALILIKSKHGTSGVSHVFACDDINRSLKAATDAGLSITHPLKEGHWGAQVAGFEDPEGNTIYLEQPNPA